MSQVLTAGDMTFHALVSGGTGTGKTNAILYVLDLLFNKKEEGGKPRPALFLFDPAGDASIDLLRAIPSSEWSRVSILDPQYVTFGFNPFSLPENLDPVDEPEVLQSQVEEFASLLSDVFNTDSTSAPRLMWIFKGALYYLYTFSPDPTLWELYNLMLLFTKKSAVEIELLLRRRVKESEIIRETMEAISKLPQDAYSPVLNRISHFVLPPTSITFRVFCSRKSTVDVEKLMEPGHLTVFRIPTTLPAEFHKLFSAAVVMKLYFASLKRAKRLEREGLPPTARTPVVFATDEFRDVSQLKILRTVLSQSRKYGLFLWMVVQTLGEVPDDLMGSIQANVGPVLAFRSSPDDARTLAKLLYPQRPEVAEPLIPGLPDYDTLVRKRPVGGVLPEPPFRVSFPKLRDPIHEYGEAISYMKVEMEKAYGGSVGDRELYYKDEVAATSRDSGECPMEYPLYWVPLTYLQRQSREVGFSVISRYFEERHHWSPGTTQVALSWLADHGKVKVTFDVKRIKTVDPKTRKLVWKEPESHAAKVNARQACYSLTPTARRDFFEFDLKNPGRAGGPEHIAAMKNLLENYWQEGCWCTWDKGDRGSQFPDILVLPPMTSQAKGKEGKQIPIMSTKEWDRKNRIAVEVETDPSRNLKQLRENYDKDVSWWGRVRFAVLSESQVEEVTRILEDKDPNTFETYVIPEVIPQDEIEEQVSEDASALLKDAAEPQGQETKTVEAKPAKSGDAAQGQDQAAADTGGLTPLRKSELWILARVCKSGYPGRSALAKGVGVSTRQVTRLLDSLETRGLLKRSGNDYDATDGGRRLVAKAGWTFLELPDRLGDLRVDTTSVPETSG
ncbi:MAG: TraM recognition domain-containing protein [Nitrososphaerota archaeon]|nr:TraM recognition domain-containing protein [Nitrososphaerota archaeon]